MSETTIIYNGIAISNVLTDSIDHEVVHEGTGVNPMFVRVTVSCTGMLHMASSGLPLTIGQTLAGYGSIATGFNAIIDQLMQPGRPFQMYVGGAPLFDVVPGWMRPGVHNPNASGTIPIRRTDANHGPIPSVRVLENISGKTLKIQFRVVMHLPYTDQDGTKLGGAVSFRFWISEDIDYADRTTTRTYQGTLRVRHLGHNVLTEIRNNFVLPPLVKGFERKRVTLQQRANGLELDWTVQDKEVWAVAPLPASSWEGYQTQFTGEKLLLVSEVFVRLKGGKDTPKQDLLVLGRKILDTKLHGIDMAYQGSTFLRSLRIKDDFRNNQVEMQAAVNMVPANKYIWNLEKGNFGMPLNVGFPEYPSRLPDYNKEYAQIASPTACIKGLFLALLQDPLHVSGIPYINEDARQLTFTVLDCPEAPPDEPDIPAETDRKISAEHLADAYTAYGLTSTTDKNWGAIQLPLGKSSAGGKTAAIISLHQPTATLRVIVEAERLNKWPNLPTPQEYAKLGCSFVPMRTPIAVSAPITSADYLKTLHHVSAEYVFAQDREASGGIPAGLLPYRVAGNDQVYVLPSSFFSGAISDKILFA